MNDKLSNVLAELAEKFGTTVEHLWAVMIRQAFISGLMSVFNIVFILSIVIAWTLYMRWYAAKEKDRYNNFMDEIGHPLILGVGGVALLLTVCIGIPVNLYDAITALGNPEFWALKQVIR